MLRDATIAHMRLNADFYRQYMVVNPVRRNPKRKTARQPSKQPLDFTFHTEEELQKQFEVHLQKMGQPGEWADNMEVSAFASALNVHVRLWQADYHYTFTPRVSSFPSDQSSDSDSDDVDERPVLNIAYHVSSSCRSPFRPASLGLTLAQSWEHYSSVRNMAGPHTGLPCVHVNFTPSASSSKKRSSVERDDEEPCPRAAKRRSPLPLFDSDSTPENSPESSSDESHQSRPQQDVPKDLKLQELTLPKHPKLKLVLKLRSKSEIQRSESAPAKLEC